MTYGVVFSFLYVLQPNTTSVAVLRLDGPGEAANVGNFNLKDAAQSSGLVVSTYTRGFARHIPPLTSRMQMRTILPA
jgi:hypothetical protein